MATELPSVTVATPSSVSTVTTTVRRSWKTRILTIANALISFVLALGAYLQSINLGSFGITADRALFYMAVFGLLQFVLMQVRPYLTVDTKVEPGSTEGQG